MMRPFEVSARDVSRLDAGFSVTVNRLLEAEGARAGMVASALVLNSVDELADGGVDAAIRDAPAGGAWIPEGDSAWQFKRSDLQPAECAAEFGGAIWAHRYVQNGGTYVVVLGVPRTDHMKQDRRDAILRKAEDLGLRLDRSQVRVYDANDLARWMCLFPSLVIASVTGRPVSAAVDFSTWTETGLGRMAWVTEEPRQAMIETIRTALSEQVAVDLRVEGAPGVGKSRLVLEAVRAAQYAPLVAYVADEAEMTGETLQHLTGLERTVVLVVDQCPADRHRGLAQRLPNDPRVKLVTIGPTGLAVTQRPILVVEPMSREGIDELLSLNFPGLSNVNRRVVVDIAGGNPQIAEIRAEQASNPDRRRSAPDLITESDIREFLTDEPIRGLTLDVAEGVALFDKLGWDDELAPERDHLAELLQVTTSDLESCGRELEEAGWLTIRSRYRAISAHRLAIHLASRKWEKDGHRIVENFLDRLSVPMQLALFRRLADLGRYEPAERALAPLLVGDGPFGSFAQLRTRDRAALLTQLAINLPNEVSLHISELLEGASDETLRAHPTVCRQLVWTLEKLAWHTETFRLAADSLLRLAIADYRPVGDGTLDLIMASSRNHAEPKWTSLFGTMLPSTAAQPRVRMEYLKTVAGSDDPGRRLLAVNALNEVMSLWESVMVSSEVQGGALIEPRGMPRTYGEAWDYQIEAINEIGRLIDDPVPAVRSAAEDHLIGAMSSLAGSGGRWDVLQRVLLGAPALHERVRHEIQTHEGLYQGHEPVVDRSDGSERAYEARMKALASLRERLPAPSRRDALKLALDKPRWDYPIEEVEQTVVDAMAAFLDDHSEAELFEFLSTHQPNAREFGAGLVILPVQQCTALEALAAAYETNPEALLGYLSRKTETDTLDIVETFLDSRLGSSLSDRARLEIARTGHDTGRLRHIIKELVNRLPVADSALLVRLTPEDLPAMLKQWTTRMATQEDYNTVIRRMAHELRLIKPILGVIDAAVLQVVLRRREFPRTGKASSDWTRLGKVVLPGNEEQLAGLVLDLIEDPERVLSISSDAADLLTSVLKRRPDLVWTRIAERLEHGSPRLETYVEHWNLLARIDHSRARDWIGTDPNRAQIAARITTLGKNEPTPIVRYLLETFGPVGEIASTLSLRLHCGLQVGKASDHIQGQIDRLTTWRENTDEPRAVRHWARDQIAKLASSQQKALQEETERGW